MDCSGCFKRANPLHALIELSAIQKILGDAKSANRLSSLVDIRSASGAPAPLCRNLSETGSCTDHERNILASLLICMRTDILFSSAGLLMVLI